MNKVVYKPEDTIVTLYFIDGSKVTKSFKKDDWNGRYLYCYGELPLDDYKVFAGNNVWEKLLSQTNFIEGYDGELTKFKKRKYICSARIAGLYFEKRIYKDELIKFTIETTYKDCSGCLPSIGTLESDLGFKDYSEFVFNREQELRKMLVKVKE